MHAGRLNHIVVVLALCCAAQAGAATVGDDEPGVLTPEAIAVLGAELEAHGVIGDYDQQGNLLLATASRLSFYYGRALPAVQAADPAAQPGLLARPRAQPAETFDYALVFEDELGRQMEQPIVPIPADWNALQASLLALPGVSAATLDEESGEIAVDLGGRRVTGRLSYLARTTIIDFELPTVYVISAGDLNGDGTGDYYVHYPLQSLVQFLYVYPQSR